MNGLRIARICLLMATMALCPARLVAEGVSATPDEMFAKASEAYNAHRFAEALSLYRQIERHGLAAPELYYNMANAHFQMGELPQAILHYRRAWRLNPRDHDISANFDFALQQASALPPAIPLHDRAVFLLSPPEWERVAIAAYWIAALALIFRALGRSPKLPWGRIAAVAGLIAAASAYPLWRWASMDRQPEVVVLDASEPARFAPLEDAPAHFEVPAGSVLREVQTQGDWTEVRSGGRKGWLPSDRLARVKTFPL